MKKGFTLIELLVVVLIIGILSAVALVQYERAVNRARLTEAFLLGKYFRDSEKIFYLENGYYASTYEELGIDLQSGWTLLTPQTVGINKSSYSIAGASSPDRITIESLPGGVALLIGFSGKNTCCSYAGTNWKGTPMCKMLGAQGTGSNDCGSGNECKCWRIN